MRSSSTSLVAVAVTLVVLAAGALILIYSGAYNVAATAGHSPLVRWLLNTIQARSVAVRADGVPEPPSVDSVLLSHGFEHFDAMCVTCHGAPGIERSEVGKGITPTPPDLQERAAALTSRELFWITKHGIKLAGMPAFGRTHSDEEIWAVVAFLQELPDMDEEAYAKWQERLLSSDTGESPGGHSHPTGAPSHSH